MKIVDVTERVDLACLLAELEGGDGEVLIQRNGQQVARLSKIEPISRTPGLLLENSAWRDFKFDPTIFAALETDEELAAEGWPT